MWLAIASIVGTLIPAILQNRGVIGAGTAGLITSLEGPLAGLLTGLSTSQTKMSDALAVLAAASGVIAVLKTTTTLPPEILTQIDNVDKDIQAALTGYVNAGKGLNLSLYAPIENV